MAEYTKQCGNRLPCGLCLITNQPCPYAWQSVEITCNGTGDSTVMTGTPSMGGQINGAKFSGGAGCTTRSVNGVPMNYHYESTVYTPYGGTGGRGYEVEQAVELTGDTCSEYTEETDDG